MGIAALLIAEALLLGGIFVVLHRAFPDFLARRSALPEPEPLSSEFDAEAAAQKLLRAHGELRGLYERLGYSLDFERQGQELLQELESLVTVEIPSFGAFREALSDARLRLQAAASLREEVPVDVALADRRSDPLLLAVEAAGDDEVLVLRILGRDPVNELLPVLEQMPYQRDGRVVWRTPIESELLHKRVVDTDRFLRRLAALETWVRDSRIRRREETRAAVLAAGDRLRRAVEQGSNYLVTPIKTLEERYAEWYLQRTDANLMIRRRALDALLVSLVKAREEGRRILPGSGAADDARDRAAGLISEYVESPWLETPKLTWLLLVEILKAEARRFPLPKEVAPSPRHRLHAVRDEVASGRFDPEESSRRLRELEDFGCSVHSLVFPLLRRSQPVVPPPLAAAPAAGG